MRFFLLLFKVAAITLLVEASSTIRDSVRALFTVKDPTIHTSKSSVHAMSRFALTFELSDQHIKLVLEPNPMVLSRNARVTHLVPSGSVHHSSKLNPLQYRVFKGKAWITSAKRRYRWQEAGWARVLIIQDGQDPLFEGTFTLNGDHHHIQLSRNYLRTRHPMDPNPRTEKQESMVVWRNSDVLPSGSQLRHQELRRRRNDSGEVSCHADELSFNSNANHPVYAAMTKRIEESSQTEASHSTSKTRERPVFPRTSANSIGDSLISTIGQTSGCSSVGMTAMVGVATDCTYTSDFDSIESARQNIIQMVNSASAVWEEALNITLSISNLTISDAHCPGSSSPDTPWNQACNSGVDIQQRLNLFSAWRTKQRDDNSHWTLLSSCNSGSTVGLSWIGQACVRDNVDVNSTKAEDSEVESGSGEQTVSGANVVVRTAGTDEWQVFAHETGHTFGAVHDCTSNTCSSSTQTASTRQCCSMSTDTCDAKGIYIMSPASRPGIDGFSPCSIGNICTAIGRQAVNTSCLVRSSTEWQDSSWISSHKPVVIGVSSACGFAIVIGLVGYWFCRFRRRASGICTAGKA